MILPVLLAGGSGTRLWPLSRAAVPKQFVALEGALSLLQVTALRLSDAASFEPPLVVANAEHRFLVAQQLAEVGVEPAAILLEPEARNTGPAIAAALAFLAQHGRLDRCLAILPSDHGITETALFHADLQEAATLAEDGRILTFGIAPDRPDTGFGYIRTGAPLQPRAFAVARFLEKPDRATAERLLAEGGHLWNSGIFLARGDRLRDAYLRHCPEILAAAEAAVAGARSDLDFLRLEPAAFAAAPAVAFDRAIMEKTSAACVLPARFGWSDLGSWNALWERARRTGGGNLERGPIRLEAVRDSCFWSADGRLLVGLGVSDLVVVSTADALLVADRARAAEIGPLVTRLAAEGQPEATAAPCAHRPWGTFEDLVSGPGFRVKRITVAPGGRLSLQRHRHRSEHWVVVSGRARVTCEEQVLDLGPNQSAYIPQGKLHRLENGGKDPLVLIEVQCGSYLGEDDIERLDDSYGRSDRQDG